MELPVYTSYEIINMKPSLLPVFQRLLGLSATATREDILQALIPRGMIRGVMSPTGPGWSEPMVTETYQVEIWTTDRRDDFIPDVMITAKTLQELADLIKDYLLRTRHLDDYYNNPDLTAEFTEIVNNLYNSFATGNPNTGPELGQLDYMRISLLRGRGPSYKLDPSTERQAVRIYNTM